MDLELCDEKGSIRVLHFEIMSDTQIHLQPWLLQGRNGIELRKILLIASNTSRMVQ